jgi:hypothetical protein
MANDTVMMAGESPSRVAERYDAFRKTVPFIQKPNVLLLTRGVADTFPDDVPIIMKMVREFDAFNEGNDPWKEHDFGAFNFRGEKIFWKIDDYNGHEGYELVMTVMLASEY